jgi:hypothetical protein
MWGRQRRRFSTPVSSEFRRCRQAIGQLTLGHALVRWLRFTAAVCVAFAERPRGDTFKRHADVMASQQNGDDGAAGRFRSRKTASRGS